MTVTAAWKVEEGLGIRCFACVLHSSPCLYIEVDVLLGNDSVLYTFWRTCWDIRQAALEAPPPEKQMDNSQVGDMELLCCMHSVCSDTH